MFAKKCVIVITRPLGLSNFLSLTIRRLANFMYYWNGVRLNLKLQSCERVGRADSLLRSPLTYLFFEDCFA